MSKSITNLLYVEKIDPFTVLAFRERTPKQVKDNYELLVRNGVDLDGRVILLSVIDVQKFFINRKELDEANISLDRSIPLQIFEYMNENYPDALEKGPLNVEAVYRQTGYITHAALTLLSDTNLYVLGNVTGLMKAYSELKVQKEKMEKFRDELEKEEDKQYFQEMIDKFSSDINNFLKNLSDWTQSEREKAEKNDTHSIQVYPFSGLKHDLEIRKVLIEDPADPGSYLYENLPEPPSDSYIDKNRWIQMEKEGVFIEEKIKHFGLETLENALQRVAHPNLIITDVYAKELYPELEQIFDINVLNKDVNLRYLDFL